MSNELYVAKYFDLTPEDEAIMRASKSRMDFWVMDRSNEKIWGVPPDGFVGYVTWVEEFNRRSEQA